MMANLSVIGCNNWWSYWNSKTWNKEHKKALAPLAISLVQQLISSVVKGISRRGVRRAGRGYMDKNF